jgi:hypothetical protein
MGSPDIKVSDGGRERSRTSGLYGDSLLWMSVYCRTSEPTRAYLAGDFPSLASPRVSTVID